MAAVQAADGNYGYINHDGELVIGQTQAQITPKAADGSTEVQKLELDVPAKIVAGRTLVPARFVAESFDAKVDWNQKTKTVSIITE